MTRPLAIVTGASSGIGLELAKLAASNGHDLIIAADTPLAEATQVLQGLGVEVQAIQADLSTSDGVTTLFAATAGRPVAVLMANAGHGLGRGFLDQDFEEVRHVIGTNITGTIQLVQLVGQEMRSRGSGRILVTGSIAGFIPGTYQAVYNGSKAFIDSFCWALRTELKNTGVSVTCLMPGVTDTKFFERADLLDTAVGASDGKMHPADVAKAGFDAMLRGDGDVVAGIKNKIQTALASVTPAAISAEQHRKMAEPGSAKR